MDPNSRPRLSKQAESQHALNKTSRHPFPDAAPSDFWRDINFEHQPCGEAPPPSYSQSFHSALDTGHLADKTPPKLVIEHPAYKFTSLLDTDKKYQRRQQAQTTLQGARVALLKERPDLPMPQLTPKLPLSRHLLGDLAIEASPPQQQRLITHDVPGFLPQGWIPIKGPPNQKHYVYL